MREPDFGWSYPPGCNGVPDDGISFEIFNNQFVPPADNEEPDDDMPDENDLSDAALNAAYWEAVDKD